MVKLIFEKFCNFASRIYLLNSCLQFKNELCHNILHFLIKTWYNLARC